MNIINSVFTPYLWTTLQVLLILVSAQSIVWLTKSLSKPGCGRTLTRISIVAPTLIWLIAIGSLLVVFGLDMSSLTEILVAGGLVIGLIVSSAGNNLVCGLLSIYNDSYRLDEVMEINGIIGRVTKITMFAIHLWTPDGSHYEIPQRLVWESIVHIYDRIRYYRIKVIVHIDDANFNLKETMGVLRTVIGAPEWNHFDDVINKERIADARYVEMASSSNVFELVVWIEDPLYTAKRKAELLEQCKLALDEAGISTGQTSNLSGLLQLQNTTDLSVSSYDQTSLFVK